LRVVGGLAKLVGGQRLGDLDHLLNHMAAARDDDDQHPAGAQRHELDAIEDRCFVGRAHAKPTLRDACDSMCDTCGSSESSRPFGLSRRNRASTGRSPNGWAA
jgi:hypothetical protein